MAFDFTTNDDVYIGQFILSSPDLFLLIIIIIITTNIIYNNTNLTLVFTCYP